MTTLNKVQVMGFLGRDPEMTYTQSGKAITKITVATTEKWKGSDGEWQENTEWHRITFFSKPAETVREYFRKGSRIYIEGKLQTSQYEKNGEKRYNTEIIANEFKFIDRQQDNTNNTPVISPPQLSGTVTDTDIPF